MTQQTLDIIAHWFEHTGGGSLRLPTRWFEKPLDVRHALTALHEGEQRVELELDADIRLVFSGTIRAHVEPSGLVIRGFTRLVVTYARVLGGVERVSEEFTGGEVLLAYVP